MSFIFQTWILTLGFVETEVDPQALDFNRKESFNIPLFKKLGELGILGITVSDKFGGSGMDAVAAVIAHEELASSDPGEWVRLFFFVENILKLTTPPPSPHPHIHIFIKSKF